MVSEGSLKGILAANTNKAQIIRFRTKEGMIRISTEPEADFREVIADLRNKLNLSDDRLISLSDKPNAEGESSEDLYGKSIKDLGLKNGDMLFVTSEVSDVSNQGNTSIRTEQHIPLPKSTPTPAQVRQLPVDDELDKEDGLIQRPRSTLCRHGDKGMCEYCSPLSPWDKDYRKEKGIKHMSFHAYVKELNEQKNNKNNATSYMAPLEELDYNIKINCPSGTHLPYPKGICSKCQPPVITLQQQQFRMVDHVEFADFSILNKFIDAWRVTGMQRFGILYGTYEKFDEVPLGIKAVVQAIYEPPQHDELDGITLLPWKNEKKVDDMAASLGMYKVGFTFTDLTDSGAGDGTVLCKRHKDTYFLSCLEVKMAAKYQIAHPNNTKYSGSGRFSSKFVTCVISGGLNGEIEPRSYQVSNSSEALVKADIITGSTQPSMLYINDSDGKRYVPDVFYLKINEYGLEVKTNAKPAFPVDYLLVSLLDSFPKNPTPFFLNNFAIENRDFMEELQNLKAAYNAISNDPGDGSSLRNFHFLVYLATLDVLSSLELSLLLSFVNSRTQDDYIKLVESPGWMTLVTILEQSA